MQISVSPIPVTGISFCIATNAKRPQVTLLSIKSIKNQPWGDIPYEIIVCGDVQKFSNIEGLILVNQYTAAHSAMLAKLKNGAANKASYNEIVFLDDDELPDLDWLKSTIEYSRLNAWDVLSNRVLNPDGTRHWDRATLSPHRMVDYDHPEDDPSLYQSGGFLLVRKHVFESIKWDETKLFYGGETKSTPEDVQYSNDLTAAGYILKFNPAATVWHNDPKYTAAKTRSGDLVVIKNKNTTNMHIKYLELVTKINSLK